MLIIDEFLGKPRAPATRRAYKGDLQKFINFTNLSIEALLGLESPQAEALLRDFLSSLCHDRPSSKRRRLAVIASFANFAREHGQCQWTLKIPQLLPVAVPRIPLEAKSIEQILEIIKTDTLIGKRDYAIICLLGEGSWKRQQLADLNCNDWNDINDINDHINQVNPLHRINDRTRQALQEWLDHHPPTPPLFTALDRQHWGQRLSGQAIYKIVNTYARRANLTLPLPLESFRQPTPPPPTPPTLTITSPHADLLTALLADRRSPNTKRAYQQDLQYFFEYTYHQAPHPQLVQQFLSNDRFLAIALVLQYKAHMIGTGLKEATVNRRLAALKALVSFANKLGHCQWSLQEISGEPIQAYRDTTGIPPAGIKAILQVVDRQTKTGKRDYAILRLLWDNALRRQEVANTNINDYDQHQRTLKILGKGKGAQQTTISLSLPTHEALNQWLEQLQLLDLHHPTHPLFIALDPAHIGHRLTGTAIYNLVQHHARTAGISKRMSPHRIRHSAITAALDATNGNVRKVQKLSRHKKLDTLMIYDDNRANLQGEISTLLSDLI